MARTNIRTRKGERGPRRRQFAIPTNETDFGPVDEPQIIRVGGGRFAPLGFGASRIHPYKIVARLKDGRRFELRINALNPDEAEKIAHEKFPLITIQKISRADKIATAKRFLTTAERLLEAAERYGEGGTRLGF